MGENNNEGRCSELVLPLIGSFSYSPFFFIFMFPSAGMKRRSAFDLEALGFFLESAPYFLYFFACLTALELSTSSCWGAGARVLDAYVRYLGRDTFTGRSGNMYIC